MLSSIGCESLSVHPLTFTLTQVFFLLLCKNNENVVKHFAEFMSNFSKHMQRDLIRLVEAKYCTLQYKLIFHGTFMYLF